MRKEKTVRTSKPIICTGIIRIPDKSALDNVKKLLNI